MLIFPVKMKSLKGPEEGIGEHQNVDHFNNPDFWLVGWLVGWLVAGCSMVDRLVGCGWLLVLGWFWLVGNREREAYSKVVNSSDIWLGLVGFGF